jgi:hypothetical protein
MCRFFFLLGLVGHVFRVNDDDLSERLPAVWASVSRFVSFLRRRILW